MKQYPILYSFRRCPYAMRARMAIFSSGVVCELREVLLSDKPEHMVKISPKATVPVLQLEDGKVIDESLEIMKWALTINDPDSFMNKYKKNSKESNEIINMIDKDFVVYLNKYKYSDRYEDSDPINNRDCCVDLLQVIEKKLSNDNYIFSNHPSLVDVAIFPLIRQFRIANQQWFDNEMPLENIKKWLTKLLLSPLFKNVMEKNNPWKQEDRIKYFPNQEL